MAERAGEDEPMVKICCPDTRQKYLLSQQQEQKTKDKKQWEEREKKCAWEEADGLYSPPGKMPGVYTQSSLVAITQFLI